MSANEVPSGKTICQSALAPGSSLPLISGPVNVLPVWGTPPSRRSTAFG